MFKKSDDTKKIEDLSKREFVRADIEFSKTVLGRKLYIYSILPAILTTITVVYIISSELANGYFDLINIGSILLVGLGLTSITKMIYFQSLAKYYNSLNTKK